MTDDIRRSVAIEEATRAARILVQIGALDASNATDDCDAVSVLAMAILRANERINASIRVTPYAGPVASFVPPTLLPCSKCGRLCPPIARCDGPLCGGIGSGG